MIPDWQTDTLFFSDLLTNKKYEETYSQLCKVLQKNGTQYHLLSKTNDIWARDYMPLQISKDKFLEYRYDPDYLQGTTKGNRDLKTYPDTVCDDLGLKTLKTEIILDGGNVVKSENAVIMTDKVVQENRIHFTRNQLIQELEVLFQTDKVILIPWDRLEKFGHADGMLRFIDNDTVLINWIYRTRDNNFRYRLLKPLKENGIKYELMDLKVNKMTHFNWAYINFLQTNDLILIPTFGLDEDTKAIEQIAIYYKSYADNGRISSVKSNSITNLGGALNCISWNILNCY